MALAVYQQLLYKELEKRCRRNPRYSLRAFARSLDLDVGNLSRAMRGKTSLSAAYTQKIVTGLGLSPKQAQAFEASLNKKTLSCTKQAKLTKGAGDFSSIAQKQFDVVSDLLHYSILEITAVKDFKPDAAWIAKALGVNKVEVELAIQRLMDVGLLLKVDGTWRKCKPMIKTKGGVTSSSASRRHQKQVLAYAKKAIDEVPVKNRYNMSLTMPIDPQKLDFARGCIEKFSKQLCESLSNEDRIQVYQLTIALFPIQKET